MRCKNCNMSIPNSSEGGFCSPRCEREFRINFNPDKQFNERGAFNLIAATIEHMFYNIRRQTQKDVESNKSWIKDVVCKAWCDCSSNFENDKLLKYYEDKCRGIS